MLAEMKDRGSNLSKGVDALSKALVVFTDKEYPKDIQIQKQFGQNIYEIGPGTR